MQDTFQTHFTVKSYECTPLGEMSVGAVLRRCQQIAADQCAMHGMDAAYYARTHTAFLLAKLAGEFFAPIHEGQAITLRTVPFAPQRAVYHRYSTLHAGDGTLLAAIDASWVLVDTETKRILRRLPEDMPPFFICEEPIVLGTKIEKLETVSETQCSALLSQCDGNLHINNTVYADIACDAMPVSTMLENRVSQIAIAYHKEIPLGEKFAVQSGLQSAQGYVRGHGNENTYFEAQLLLTTR